MSLKDDHITAGSERKIPIGLKNKFLPDIEAIYVHIPFCLKKCYYCDFISYPVHGSPVEAYCRALLDEGSMYQRFLSGSQKEVNSIYIGGGTPTCLPALDLVKIVAGLKNLFPVRKNGEITVECNPGTVNEKYLFQLKQVGVNRLSIGAQVFDNKLLWEMGRVHGSDDIKKTVFDARDAGFDNISLDLIYGLPNQNIEQWSDTLAQALALPITHLSIYGLKLSEESLWGKSYQEGSLILPDEDISQEMQELAMDYLNAHGFNHYEIANFALPGFFSSHNRVYWKNNNYLGLGLAASSHWSNTRQTNCTTFLNYIEEIKKGNFPVSDWEVLERETEMAETIFLGLRLLAGLDLETFKQRYGVDLEKKYQTQINKLYRLGLLERFHDRIRLTKNGIFLANEVFIEFLP